MKISGIIEKKLFSPPEIYLKLRNTMDDPKHTFSDLEKVIETDPVLAARLLKIANSVFYAQEGRIESIKQALSIIGSSEVSNLVLSATVSDKFRMIPKDLLDMESFWKHSLTCAIAATLLAEKQKISDTSLYYLAGLLHDIGSLVIFLELPEKAIETLSYASETGKLMYWVEDQIIGFNHAEMGGALFRDWGLPEKVIEGVKHHHTPLLAKIFPDFCAHIHIADITACKTKIGRPGEPQAPTFAPNIIQKVNMTSEDIDSILPELEKRAETVFQLFFD
jgi:putative nucleotidyltransferase with HDIG domain